MTASYHRSRFRFRALQPAFAPVLDSSDPVQGLAGLLSAIFPSFSSGAYQVALWALDLPTTLVLISESASQLVCPLA